FYSGGIDQLKAQFIGSLTCVVVISAVSLLLFFLVDLTRTLRVSAEGEQEGIDLHEHGTHAYHMEFGQGSSFSSFPSSGSAVSNGATEPVQSENEPASS
ncbi:MAG TPA: hypothetical protein VGQ80_13035, partial [Acidimicrobiia bacterium]|nr:hypothetical protein [Acidimicrobiia bacterium]